MRRIPTIKTGQYWKAFSTDQDNDNVWLFYIVLKTVKDHKWYFLGVKYDWDSKKPIIDFESEGTVQVWWFDSNGEGPEDFYLAELIGNELKKNVDYLI